MVRTVLVLAWCLACAAVVSQMEIPGLEIMTGFSMLAVPMALMTLVLAGSLAWLFRTEPERCAPVFAGLLSIAWLVATCGLSIEYIPGRLYATALAMGLLLVCGGIGQTILARCTGDALTSPWMRVPFAATLGLGFASTTFFALGHFRADGTAFGSVLFLAAIFMWRGIMAWLSDLRSMAASLHTRLRYDELLAVVAPGLIMLALYPLAFVPPMDYDITEYHAGLPKLYLALGHIRPDAANVFSTMPQIMETWTTVCMALAGEGTGLIASQLLHWLMGLLLLVLGAAFAHRIVPGAGFAALMLLAGLPRVMQTSTLLYTEGGLCLFMLAACVAVDVYHSASSPAARRQWALIIGLCTAFAFGAKYTALLFAVPPLLVMMAWPSGGQSFRRDMLFDITRAAVSFLVMTAPWWIWNWIAVGNPLAPLFNRFFRVPGWDTVLDARFFLAHRPNGDGAFSLHAVFESASLFVATGGESSPVLWILLGCGLLAGAQERARGICYGLAATAVWMGMAWFLFTHRIERFAMPAYVVAAVACACLLTVRAKGLLHTGAMMLMFYGVLASGLLLVSSNLLMANAAIPRCAWGLLPPAAALQQDDSYKMGLALQQVNPNARLLALGEARGLYLPATVDCPVVFSHHPVEQWLHAAPDADAFEARLRAAGYSGLLINWLELARLHATYSRAFDFAAAEQGALRTFFQRHAATTQIFRPWYADKAPDRLMAPSLLHDFSLVMGRPYTAREPLAGYFMARPWVAELYADGGVAPSFLAGHFLTFWSHSAALFEPQETMDPIPVLAGPYVVVWLDAVK